MDKGFFFSFAGRIKSFFFRFVFFVLVCVGPVGEGLQVLTFPNRKARAFGQYSQTLCSLILTTLKGPVKAINSIMETPFKTSLTSTKGY